MMETVNHVKLVMKYVKMLLPPYPIKPPITSPRISIFTWGAGYPSGLSRGWMPLGGEMIHRWWRRLLGLLREWEGDQQWEHVFDAFGVYHVIGWQLQGHQAVTNWRIGYWPLDFLSICSWDAQYSQKLAVLAETGLPPCRPLKGPIFNAHGKSLLQSSLVFLTVCRPLHETTVTVTAVQCS